MPTFEIQAPDGQTYEIEGENEAGAAQALHRYLAAQAGVNTREDFQSGEMFRELGDVQRNAFEQPTETPSQEPTWSLGGSTEASDHSDNLMDIMGGALWNAPRNMIKTGLAATDALTGENRAESFSQTIPRYDYGEGGAEQVVGGASEYLTGAAAGVKTIGQAIPSLPNIARTVATGGPGIVNKMVNAAEGVVASVPKVVNIIKNIAAAEMGGAAAVDEDVDTLLMGNRAILPMIEGMAIDPEGNYSEELLKKKLNILGDSLIIAGLAAPVAGGAKLLWNNALKPVLKLGSTDEMGKSIVRDFLQSVIDAKPEDTPQDVAAKFNQIIDAAEQNKKVDIPTDGEDITIKRDTASAIDLGLDPEDKATRARVRGARAGVEGRGAPELEAAMAQPSNQAENYLGHVDEISGGEAATKHTRENIQESVHADIDPYRDDLADTKRRLDESKKGIEELIKGDPTFGEALEQLGKAANIDFVTASNKSADAILENINRADELMTRQKNELWAAIPDDVGINYKAFTEKLRPVMDILPPKVLTKIEGAGGNWKLLDEIAHFDLTDAITKYGKEGEFGKARALREFKQHITTEQLQYLTAHGDREVRDAADAALEYYTKVYAPAWRDGRLEELQQITRDNFYKERNRAVKQRKLLTGTLENPQEAEYSEQIIDVLSREEGGANPTLALDYVFSRIADEIQPILNKDGGLSTEKITEIGNKLSKFVPVFDKIDPQQVARINDFLTKLRERRFTTKELEEAIVSKEAALKDFERKTFKKNEKFFDIYGDEVVAKENDDAIFDEVFGDPEVLRDLPNIIKQATRENPEKIKGLRGAYARYFRQQMFRSKEGSAGEHLQKPLDHKQLKKMFQIGDKLFEDEPIIMDAVKGIVGEAQRMANTRTSGKQPVFDISEFRKAAGGGLDFFITQAFGALSRMGARVRSAAGRGLAALDPSDTAKQMVDRIFADPDEFIRIARQVSEEAATKGHRRQLIRFLLPASIYNDAQRNEILEEMEKNETDLQTEAMLE